MIGGAEKEIQLEIDPVPLAHYGISLTSRIHLLVTENVNTPAGTMELGSAKYVTRVPGEFKSPEELESLVTKRGPDGVVYLRNFATVRMGLKDSTTISRVNGISSVTLTISKHSAENSIVISDQLLALVEHTREAPAEAVEGVVPMNKAP